MSLVPVILSAASRKSATQVMDDVRTVANRAASTNPIFMSRVAHSAASTIDTLLSIIGEMETVQNNMLQRLADEGLRGRGRPRKTTAE